MITYSLFTIEILEELQRRLDGKCSEHTESCPMIISNELHGRTFWSCTECQEMFEGYIDLNISPGGHASICPCTYAKDAWNDFSGDQVIARLDEFLEELKK